MLYVSALRSSLDVATRKAEVKSAVAVKGHPKHVEAAVERTITFDIRDRNDVDGRGESYHIYQLDGDPRFFVDLTRSDVVEHNEFDTFDQALACAKPGCVEG